MSTPRRSFPLRFITASALLMPGIAAAFYLVEVPVNTEVAAGKTRGALVSELHRREASPGSRCRFADEGVYLFPYDRNFNRAAEPRSTPTPYNEVVVRASNYGTERYPNYHVVIYDNRERASCSAFKWAPPRGEAPAALAKTGAIVSTLIALGANYSDSRSGGGRSVTDIH